jgi:mannose-6-phosphate isomerase-like protein (cupin superfamily)
MSWKKIDLNTMPGRDIPGGKRMLWASDMYHVWMHNDPPGTIRGRVADRGAQLMHLHYADETFFCIQGELTIRFHDPDGEEVVPAGSFIVVPKGQLYSLENTSGTEQMILLGTRAEAHDVAIADGFDRGMRNANSYTWAVEQTDEEKLMAERRPQWGVFTGV